MIVFKTFLKILNKNKGIVILYTVILVAFGGFHMKISDHQTTHFQMSQPDVCIINQDGQGRFIQNFIQYMKDQCHLVEFADEDAVSDALFYREISYIITIPDHYQDDFLAGRHPQMLVESTSDYEASYVELLLSRYMKMADFYRNIDGDEQMIIEKMNHALAIKTDIEIQSQINTDALSQATFYYNFMNYSLLAGCVYVICLILSSFREEHLYQRICVSSMMRKKHDFILLLSNGMLALTLWLIYVFLSFVLVGKIMFTKHGFLYICHSFFFAVCALTIAFLIANLIKNKNTINGIVNVVALGSSFLCGAFVPVDFLPDFVLKIAHVLPSYWYIQGNEFLATLETIDVVSIQPLLIDMGVLVVFSMLFFAISLMVSKRKQS